MPLHTLDRRRKKLTPAEEIAYLTHQLDALITFAERYAEPTWNDDRRVLWAMFVVGWRKLKPSLMRTALTDGKAVKE